MERFAKIKNVGKRCKLDVKAICRCCGLASDDKEEILGQYSDDGVYFFEKVEVLTGIKVSLSDKMPQSMCSLCIDKINDFYEFRLMAQNTEKQTREALRLPPYKEHVAEEDPVREIKPLVVRLVDLKYQTEDSLIIERALSKANIPSTSKKRLSAPSPQPSSKKSKKDVSCSICVDTHFGYQNDLNDHLTKEHLPLVAKYACGSCRETFEQLSDHKAHESKHSKEKLPYTCYICCTEFTRARDYNKHTTNYNCRVKEKLEMTVEDIKCFQCKKKFLTQNLFEWHGCFLKNRGKCIKCGQYFAKKKFLLKHYVLCDEKFETPEAALDPNRNAVKAENSKIKTSVNVSNVKETKGPKKKIVPPRKMSTMPNIVKKELNLDALTGEPVEDDDYSNYEEDITYDNFGNDSDSNDAFSGALQPVVELQEQRPTVRIKQEPQNESVVKQKSTSMLQPNHVNSQIIRNIKKEKSTVPTITTRSASHQQNNSWKLKIKAERGGSGKPTAQVLNPIAFTVLKQSQSIPNSFKIPHELKMKIKLEKKDAGYGDNLQELDEAEAEDEDLLGEHDQPVVKIKQEKMDPAYGDISKKKHLINPMALMKRDKPSSNGSVENSLVISAVTSINPVSPSNDEGGDTTTQSTLETLDVPQGTQKTNDVTVTEKQLDKLVMVEIPRGNCKNHSSSSNPAEDTSEIPQNHVNAVNKKQSVPENTSKDDDLDALLKIYEDAPPATDSSDLFQELLTFD